MKRNVAGKIDSYSLLLDLLEKLEQCESIPNVLERIPETLDQMGLLFGKISEVNDDGTATVSKVSDGFTLEGLNRLLHPLGLSFKFSGFTYPVTGTIWESVYVDGHTLVSDDIELERLESSVMRVPLHTCVGEYFKGSKLEKAVSLIGTKRVLRASGVSSMVLCPFRGRDRVIGAILITGSKSYRITEEHIELLQACSKMVGQACSKILVRNEVEATLEKLRRSEQRNRLLVEHAPFGVMVLDSEGGIVDANKKFLSIAGEAEKEKIVGKNALDFISPDSIVEGKKLLEMIPERSESYLDNSDLSDQKSLRVHTNILSQDPFLLHVTIEDITEQLILERNIAQSQKLESLGVLAGGIAHDFNNILAGIVSTLSHVKLEVESDKTVLSLLDDAEQAALGAKKLTGQLLTFAKGEVFIREASSLTDIVRKTVSFTLRGSKSKAHLDFPEDLWPVDVDQSRIGQVISNLVINADQAQPNGGKITIQAENIIDPETLHKVVKLTIHDQGVGIKDEHLGQIFDPYFTTKDLGSGLGLAVCYSVVEKHGGTIIAESQPGKGTTFTVLLPASLSKPASKVRKDVDRRATAKRVLLMDDEELILRGTGRLLKKLGYHVVLARDGDEALVAYQRALRSERPFDVVILDLTIPGGLGGKETIGKLRSFDPDVRAIVSTGYSANDVLSDYERFGFKAALTKPYEIEELVQAIRKATL